MVGAVRCADLAVSFAGAGAGPDMGDPLPGRCMTLGTRGARQAHRELAWVLGTAGLQAPPWFSPLPPFCKSKQFHTPGCGTALADTARQFQTPMTLPARGAFSYARGYWQKATPGNRKGGRFGTRNGSRSGQAGSADPSQSGHGPGHLLAHVWVFSTPSSPRRSRRSWWTGLRNRRNQPSPPRRSRGPMG